MSNNLGTIRIAQKGGRYILGNSKKKRRQKVHRRIIKALGVTGCLLCVGIYIHHEFAMLVAGSAAAAFFDIVFAEVF